jgi:hypothetical protein
VLGGQARVQLPPAALKSGAAQGVHEEAVRLYCVPAAQFWQVPRAGEKMSGWGHSKVENPVPRHCPEGQGWQDDAPGKGLYVPEGQGWQISAPEELKFPARQGRQAAGEDWPVRALYVPAGQESVQAEDVRPAVEP